jgi:hypothetical protein
MAEAAYRVALNMQGLMNATHIHAIFSFGVAFFEWLIGKFGSILSKTIQT